jgi:hypothetical protein
MCIRFYRQFLSIEKDVFYLFFPWLFNFLFSYISRESFKQHIVESHESKFIYLFVFIHLFTYAYIVWVISPPDPPQSAPHPPGFQAEPVLPLSLILLKRRHKHKKKDKAFLLVELRVAIQRDSYHCFHVQMWHNPSWLISNWSLHWFLILIWCWPLLL